MNDAGATDILVVNLADVGLLPPLVRPRRPQNNCRARAIERKSLRNEIVLPAGMFTVPGYKDAELDDALVYGYAAASTIGHELTHGFGTMY